MSDSYIFFCRQYVGYTPVERLDRLWQLISFEEAMDDKYGRGSTIAIERANCLLEELY